MTINLKLQLGISEIAEIAGVSVSAVSQWRKRHSDFPKAQGDGSAGYLFDFEEIQAWLVENGKIGEPVPNARLTWSIANALRNWWSISEVTEFVTSVLLIIESERRTPPSTQDLVKAPTYPRDDHPITRLIEVAQSIEEAQPELRGLILGGLSLRVEPPAEVINRLLDVLNEQARDGVSFIEIFEELVSRRSRTDRFTGEFFTPLSICELLGSLVSPDAKVVVDPAAGTGALLGGVDRWSPPANGPRRLIGIELNVSATREARARFFLSNQAVDIQQTNTFEAQSIDEIGADVVLLQGPFGMKKWASAEVIMSPRWPFGSPPSTSADFAWLQLAYRALRPGGAAYVVLPRGSLFVGGRAGAIRQSMLRAGAIEAIIALPGRLLLSTSLPVVVWILRKPSNTEQKKRVLFVDATTRGDKGKTQVTLSSQTIRSIVEALTTGFGNDDAQESELRFIFAKEIEELGDGNLWTPFVHDQIPEEPTRTELERQAADLRAELAVSLTTLKKSLAELGDWIGKDLK